MIRWRQKTDCVVCVSVYVCASRRGSGRRNERLHQAQRRCVHILGSRGEGRGIKRFMNLCLPIASHIHHKRTSTHPQQQTRLSSSLPTPPTHLPHTPTSATTIHRPLPRGPPAARGAHHRPAEQGRAAHAPPFRHHAAGAVLHGLHGPAHWPVRFLGKEVSVHFVGV